MLAASTRSRSASPNLTVLPPPVSNKPSRPIGIYVLIAIPVLLGLTFIWTVASSVFHSDAGVRQAASVGQVTLESDPAGSRIDFVLVDRVGQETTFTGSVTIRLREPDGGVWQTRRTLGPTDFRPILPGGLLSGRPGYSVVVPAQDWARPPRRGGAATVTVEVNPTDGGPAFSTVAQQQFP